MYLPVIIFAIWSTLTIYLVIEYNKYKYCTKKALDELYDTEEILDSLISDKEVRQFLESKGRVKFKYSGEEITVSWKVNRG